MTALNDDPNLHSIIVERDSDGEVTSIRFVCSGDQSSPCHNYPDCGCETWSESAHFTEDENGVLTDEPAPGHEATPKPGCWIDPWFNETTTIPLDWEDLYDGHTDFTYDPDWLVSGPVSVTFEGDYMTWEYAA
jgi:hypothetical protein